MARPTKRQRIADDEEVAKYEKKLGLKSKKLSTSFAEDGLSGLLGNLEDVDALLEEKQQSSDESAGDDGDFDGFSDADTDDTSTPDAGAPITRPQPHQQQTHQRENPFVPPVVPSQAKYIPPSRRAAPSGADETKSRIRRQVQGSINKLSESNMLSIVTEIEKVYQAHPRQFVHDSVIDIVLALVEDPAALNTTFLVLHAAFLAALYRIQGVDFGAQCIQRIVDTVTSAKADKRALNSTSLLSHLFNFDLTTSTLIFDLMREQLSAPTESSIELLLRIIRSCGSELQRADSNAIKDVADSLKSNMAGLPSARGQYMLDEIRNLQKKQAFGRESEVGTLLTQFRKVLGGLNQRGGLRGTRPMTVGLKDLRDGERRGKWWRVGASYSDQPLQPTPISSSTTPTHEPSDDPSPDLTALARSHNMLTPIHRAIFTTLMRHTTHADATTALLKLDLTRAQQGQIPGVLVYCNNVEGSYNPYYALVARGLCGVRRVREGLGFEMRRVVKRLEDGGEDGGGLSTSGLLCCARFFGDLVAGGALSLAEMKSVDFRGLEGRARTLMVLLLGTVVLKSKGSMGVWDGCIKYESFAGDLAWFLRKRVGKGAELWGKEKERRRVREGCTKAAEYIEAHT